MKVFIVVTCLVLVAAVASKTLSGDDLDEAKAVLVEDLRRVVLETENVYYLDTIVNSTSEGDVSQTYIYYTFNVELINGDNETKSCKIDIAHEITYEDGDNIGIDCGTDDKFDGTVI